ncbi:TonB-dependent receptor [Novosphingobium sp. AAP93]|uniref:TonB-dependent receptor n=1 Tax=Novosphingobium sp. AAP93 TaxID=1523427 RepID=UPI0006B958E3|nr:TonB-dependent receptor [Novosphingobium sp. AAP93]KPF86659.1 TonB-dependent receptor [Novosphingobium sp. AAP93]
MTHKFILLAGLSGLALSQPVRAQEVAAPAETAEAAAPAAGIEEIVVTAQKREQNLQSVPAAVTALSSEAIANARLSDFSDLTRAAPALTITQTTTSPNNSIILRGIGTFAFSIGVEPSVAVIIDDMPVVQQAQAFDNLADLQRIEVLKGPQGTLFGKNSSAGVVNIVTKDPSRDFEGSLNVTAATDGDVRTEAAVSVPLSDGVGLRVTGFYHDFPGNVRNLTSGRKLNDQENYGLRAKLRAELGSNLTFTLTGAYGKAVQDGAATTIRSISGTGTPRVFGSPALALLPSLTGITPGDENYNARVDTAGATRNETASIAGKFNLDLGFANLISVTAYQDWKFNFETDFDGTDLNVLGGLTGGALNGGLVQSGPYHSTNFTQELRLVSGGRSALKYVVGAFYSNAKTSRAFQRGPVVAAADWSARNSSESLGLFAQVDYTLPTNTTVSGGIRYNHEKIGVSFDNNLASATANTCLAGNPLCRGTNSDSVVTFKASISQELARQIMLYGSVSRGYKGYAYDITSGFNPARIDASLNGTGPGLLGVGPVRPETSTSWEAGLKSRFADNRIQLNVIGFLTDYNDFQAQSAILVGNPPAPQFVLNNVGKLRTKGVEVELTAKPTDWLRIDGGASYTDAIMRSFPAAQGYAGQTGQVWNGTASALVGPCVAAAPATAASPRTTCAFQDRSGARLPNSPKLKWNIGATAEFGLGGDVKGTAILTYQHQSSVNFDLLGNPLLVQEGYGVVNGSLGVEFGKVRVTAFVNNLFDKHYAASLTDGYGVLGGSASNDAHVVYQFQTRDSQRYAGIKLGVKF